MEQPRRRLKGFGNTLQEVETSVPAYMTVASTLGPTPSQTSTPPSSHEAHPPFDGRTKLGHIAGLDGLRGLAILLVVAHHASLRWNQTLGPLHALFRYGWIGVDIFFALSGFLITSRLLSGRLGLAGLRTFYLKRALRIWPLYYILLFVVCAYAYAVHQHYPWQISLLFCQNWMPNWPNVGFEQTWSLCIEEHFYVVWPLLVLFCSRAVLPWTLGFVIVGSPLLRWWALAHGVSTKLLYSSTQYRLDAIALGSLIALLYVARRTTREQLRRIGISVLPVVLVCVCLELSMNSAQDGQRSAVLYTLLAILSASMLTLALGTASGLFGKALAFGPLRYIGKISYGLYMFHPFVFMTIGRLKIASPREELLVALVLSFLLSVLSWHLVERRIIGLFGRRHTQPVQATE